MGRIKEVLAELDNGAEVVITQWGMTFSSETLTKVPEQLTSGPWQYHLTTNDLEQTMNVLKYLREMRPFETLAEITGSQQHIDFPDLKTIPEVAAVPGSVKKK